MTKDQARIERVESQVNGLVTEVQELKTLVQTILKMTLSLYEVTFEESKEAEDYLKYDAPTGRQIVLLDAPLQKLPLQNLKKLIIW